MQSINLLLVTLSWSSGSSSPVKWFKIYHARYFIKSHYCSSHLPFCGTRHYTLSRNSLSFCYPQEYIFLIFTPFLIVVLHNVFFLFLPSFIELCASPNCQNTTSTWRTLPFVPVFQAEPGTHPVKSSLGPLMWTPQCPPYTNYNAVFSFSLTSW